MRLISRSIPEISKHDTPARWYCPEKGGWILIHRMTDDHLLNAIGWAIRRKGHKVRKFQALVDEAIRRRLPLPVHRWILLPEGYRSEEGYAASEFGGYNPAWRD